MRSKLIAVPVALVASFALAAGPALADDLDTDDIETEDIETEDEKAETEAEEAEGEEAEGEEAEDEKAEDEKAECNDVEVSEVDGDVEQSTLEAAAAEAADAAEGLEAGDGCVTGWDRAVQSFEATIERLSAEGAGGNGVAAEVLQALIDRVVSIRDRFCPRSRNGGSRRRAPR